MIYKILLHIIVFEKLKTVCISKSINWILLFFLEKLTRVLYTVTKKNLEWKYKRVKYIIMFNNINKMCQIKDK